MILENVYFRKKTGHNRGPPQQTYYWGSGLLMGYPLEKLFGCCFLLGFNKASYIWGNWACLRIPNETEKSKEKTLAKEKDKRNVWFFSIQAAAGHNRGPPQQTYYLGSILLMENMKNNK